MGVWEEERAEGGREEGRKVSGEQEVKELNLTKTTSSCQPPSVSVASWLALLTFPLNLCFANGHEEVGREGLLRHGEGDAVHELTLQHHHWVRVTDS